MKIWELKSDNNFGDFQLANFDQDKHYFKENCVKKRNWNTPQLYSIDKGPKGDNPHFWGSTGTLAFSKRSVETLEDLITSQVEILPIFNQENDGEFFLINILNALDAVDISHSIEKKLTTGLLIGYTKLAFKPELLKESDIFHLRLHTNKRIMSTRIFVTDTFRNRVEDANLLGFLFEEVWSETSNAELS
ncbi:imm11 family protein [Paenibacillus sp. P36]|uniref:imm11 family protein n=1 Tax=Paenibacillus sp. P36 TaxID=3342538 RepID=UPI0038B34F06